MVLEAVTVRVRVFELVLEGVDVDVRVLDDDCEDV